MFIECTQFNSFVLFYCDLEKLKDLPQAATVPMFFQHTYIAWIINSATLQLWPKIFPKI